MSPVIHERDNCTHIRFRGEDLIHLGQLKTMSLIFRLENGQYLTLSADLTDDFELGPQDSVEFICTQVSHAPTD